MSRSLTRRVLDADGNVISEQTSTREHADRADRSEPTERPERPERSDRSDRST